MRASAALRPFLPRDLDALAYLVGCAWLGTAIGLLSGSRILLLALTAVPPYLLFLDRMRAGRRPAALWLMVAWAASQAVAVVVLTQWQPDGATRAVVNGPNYREAMFHWIRTGEGAEGNWRRFLPEHALHYGVFLVLSALTAGAGGILLGTLLLNYMSFYVAGLFLADRAGAHTLTLSLMGWPIWSMIRVVGFIAGAVAAADLTLTLLRRGRGHRLAGGVEWPAASASMLSLSVALVILDALIKALLAPSWRLALLPVVGASAP